MMNKKSPLEYLKNWINLELHTDSGKINYRWGLLLIGLIIVLTSSNWIVKGIALVVGAIKTFILKENIVEVYEETNTITLIILTFLFFVFCFIVLFVYERNKEKVQQKIDGN